MELQRRHDRMGQVSPEVGQLDEGALAGALGEDLDEGVSMLVDLSRATDVRLRDQARRLAAALIVPAVRAAGQAPPGGSSRLGRVADVGVDLDLDSTLDRLAESPRLRVEDLRWRGWQRPGRAVVLVVDASGSVTGTPLNTAIVTAAALAARTGSRDQLAVVAFWSRAVVLRHIGDPSAPASVLARLLALRGGDTTDLAGGLRAGLGQIVRAVPAKRDVIVLTDGMANEGDDPLPVAASAASIGARLHVMALRPEPEARQACLELAAAGGGVVEELDRAAQAPAALARILS